MSNQHILPADYWTQHVYNITPGKEIKCFGHKIKDKKVMDNLLREALKNIESKSGSISGVQLTTPVKPSDLTNETNVMERKAMDSAEQQAKKEANKAVLAIKQANTTAIKSNTMQGLPAKPTSATPIQVSKPTAMTPSNVTEKPPTVGEAVESVQKAVGHQATQVVNTVQKAVGDAVEAARNTLDNARETAAATITDAAKAISPKSATENTPAAITTTQATSTMGGGRRRTKRRKRRRKHKTKHKRKKKRTTRKRKKRTRRRRR